MYIKKRNYRSKKSIFVWTAIVLLIIGVAANIWVSSNRLTVNHFTYISDKLSPDQAIRLVVLADLHDHEFWRENNTLVSKVAEQQPDVILLAGDMLNGSSEDTETVCRLVESLCEIAPVYYGLGNHELSYMEENGKHLLEEVTAAGAVVVEKSYVDIELNGNVIRVGGMYDYAFGTGSENQAETVGPEIREFLEEYQDTENLKIMLTHRPDSFIFGNAAAYWDVDLVLSGHLHGGQVVIPFLGGLYGGDQGWFPEYVHGLYEKDGMQIFLTSGLGSNPKIIPRFNNLPEIAVVEIK